MKEIYRVLIVDDEAPARDLLNSYVQKIDDLEVAAVVRSALEAKKIMRSSEVDILLTDVQMDDLNGIELVKSLKNPPITIFTTAYSEYALEGYELDVIDYLLKPISFQRFCKAIDKAIELVRHKKRDQKAHKNPTLNDEDSLKHDDFVFIKTNRKLVKTNFQDILFVQSYGEYVKVHTKDDVLLALQTTTHMESVLPPSDFIRIHRSTIINLQHVSEIVGNEVVIDQHRLTISKRMKEKFLKQIGDKGVI